MEDVTAMPQMIEALEVTNPFVQHIRTQAEKILKGYKPFQSIKLNERQTVNWSKEGANSGIYFYVGKQGSVDVIYYYKALKASRLGFVASEALAYKFNSEFKSAGLIKNIFYGHLLPNRKIVLTDAEYTYMGRQYFNIQYGEAIENPSKYGILLVDTSKSNWWLLTPSLFDKYNESYWGKEEWFKRYRFGIYLKTEEEKIIKGLGDRLFTLE